MVKMFAIEARMCYNTRELNAPASFVATGGVSPLPKEPRTMANHTPNQSKKQSTVAPSEAHLEDWIVRHPSAFYYRFEEPGALGNWNGRYQILDKIVARQHSLPCGYPDLMGVDWQHCFRVLELKRGVINDAAFMQVLRYMADVRDVMRTALSEANLRYVPDPTNPNTPPDEHEIVGGILIGHSVESDRLVRIAAAANVQIYLYEYRATANRYQFYDVADTYPRYKGVERYQNPLYPTLLRTVYRYYTMYNVWGKEVGE